MFGCYVRLLWPSFLQVLHSLIFFVGGREVLLSCDRFMGVGREFECVLSMSADGVPARLVGLGPPGSGHVRSLASSGQNSQILSYRYHCRSMDRPFGVTWSGSKEDSGGG